MTNWSENSKKTQFLLISRKTGKFSSFHFWVAIDLSLHAQYLRNSQIDLEKKVLLMARETKMSTDEQTWIQEYHKASVQNTDVCRAPKYTERIPWIIYDNEKSVKNFETK